ncbi:transglutaminase-like domain-containing protein [Streptomyces sp. AS02]|uniref:transglutaminase-like domain-containing protein n=1 Tax=Streptomyces sp. AS02 TaxID=2938946 RepID=UPI002020268F|nr:transglutaminase-like domain-containing protein [Streptomyces sp. AS02]MCL8015963.1 transglutaminase-like domain-containing protein [Streptomyces sp. AS02]
MARQARFRPTRSEVTMSSLAPPLVRPVRPGHRTESRRDLRDRLRRSVLGDVPVHPSIPVREAELPAATLACLRMGRTFRTRGLAAALPLLPATVNGPRERNRCDEITAFYAREAAWRVLGLARTLGRRGLCLHESLGVCAALRRLGFPAAVVIGYPVIEVADGTDELHAWPVLGSLPLTGRPGGRPLNYVELQRYPEEAAPCC